MLVWRWYDYQRVFSPKQPISGVSPSQALFADAITACAISVSGQKTAHGQLSHELSQTCQGGGSSKFKGSPSQSGKDFVWFWHLSSVNDDLLYVNAIKC